MNALIKLYQISLLSIVALLIGSLLIFSTIPINNNMDIVSKVTIKNTALGGPKIMNVQYELTPHTLYKLNHIGGIFSSSDLRLFVHGSGLTNSKDIGTVYVFEEKDFQIILQNVPKTTSKIEIELMMEGKIIDTYEVKLS